MNTTAMFSFEALADEIILEILKHLEDDNLTLSSLCYTSSRLYSLARPVSYKNIHLKLPPHGPVIELARSINSNPDLVSFVHHLDLNWPKSGYIPPNDKVRIQHLLQNFTSLRKLSVRAPHDQAYILSFLQFAEYNELQYVLFNYPDLTHATMMRFMFLPKLRVMDIVFLKSLSDPTIPPGCQPGTSPLKALRFGKCTPREVVLKTFLECPAALETLDFGVPPYDEQFQTSTLRREFSPRKIGEAMLPVKHSLVRLNIFEGLIHRHDGSRLDLSGFERLKNVSLPPTLLFNSSRPYPSRDGAYRLLPRSLESLEVVFWEPPWIFTFDPWIDEDVEAATAPKEKWILELASNKATYFPSLSQVRLRELPRDHHPYLTGLKLDIPQNVQDTFDEKGIYLRIWTRLLTR